MSSMPKKNENQNNNQPAAQVGVPIVGANMAPIILVGANMAPIINEPIVGGGQFNMGNGLAAANGIGGVVIGAVLPPVQDPDGMGE